MEEFPKEHPESPESRIEAKRETIEQFVKIAELFARRGEKSGQYYYFSKMFKDGSGMDAEYNDLPPEQMSFQDRLVSVGFVTAVGETMDQVDSYRVSPDFKIQHEKDFLEREGRKGILKDIAREIAKDNSSKMKELQESFGKVTEQELGDVIKRLENILKSLEEK